jgi:hypothetical protein
MLARDMRSVKIAAWTCPAAALVLLLGCIARAGDRTSRAAFGTREIFEVSLDHTTGYLLGARGRTVVETRAGCGVIHTLQRSLADVTYKDGQPIRTDFTIETWESSAGRSLRFRVRNAQTGRVAEIHDGIARLSANDAGRVTFMSGEKSFALPRGTMFPGAFARAMLDAARKGRNLDNRLVFQGGDRKGLLTAAARIGQPLEPPHESAQDPSRLFENERAWPVLISYFPERAELPASEVAAHFYANGLLGSLSLIYADYSLRATLTRVDRLPSSC